MHGVTNVRLDGDGIFVPIASATIG